MVKYSGFTYGTCDKTTTHNVRPPRPFCRRTEKEANLGWVSSKNSGKVWAQNMNGLSDTRWDLYSVVALPL
jgi:uncharacterized OB-fold protein